MIVWYILKGRKVVKAKTMDEAVAFYADREARRVASTLVDGIHISTVFLCLDHRVFGDGPPVVFETMVFDHRGGKGEDIGDWSARYTTYQDALDGHNKTVDEVKALLRSSTEIAQNFTKETDHEHTDKPDSS